MEVANWKRFERKSREVQNSVLLSGSSWRLRTTSHGGGQSLLFEALCFFAVGQEPDVRDLPRSLQAQGCGKPLDPALVEDELAAQALQAAAIPTFTLTC